MDDLNGVEGNSTDVDHDLLYSGFDILIRADDVWLLISSCVTVVTNVILLCSIFKCNYRSSTYLLIAYFSFFDILQQPFSIAMFRLLCGIHKSFKSLRVLQIMTTIYFSLNCKLVVILMLILLKNTVQFIERKLVYFLVGLWALIGCNLIFCFTTGRFHFDPSAFSIGLIEQLVFVYVMYYILLVVVIYVEQIIDTVKLGREHPSDYSAGLLIAYLFCAAKTLAVFLAILWPTIGYPINSVLIEVIIGLTQLYCILYVGILSYIDAKFKSNVLKILKLDLIRNKGQINFIQISRENVNIVVDSS